MKYDLIFPKDKTFDELYEFAFRQNELLSVILSSIDEDNLSQNIKNKIWGEQTS